MATYARAFSLIEDAQELLEEAAQVFRDLGEPAKRELKQVNQWVTEIDSWREAEGQGPIARPTDG